MARVEDAVIRQLKVLREEIQSERGVEIKRAIAIGSSNPKQAAYHTGLADARNGLVKKLNLIIEMSNHQTSRESA